MEWCYRIRDKYDYKMNPHSTTRMLIQKSMDWKEYTVTRRFRGSEYRITVKNPDGVSKGVRNMVVDGDETSGNVIPLLGDHGVHDVEVILGKEGGLSE